MLSDFQNFSWYIKFFNRLGNHQRIVEQIDL